MSATIIKRVFMDVLNAEISDAILDSKNDSVLSEELKVKTSLRMVYEAQTQVIRQQIGRLEEVREKLGLSQRKISQLLMVDPSAWTRWTKDGLDSAPPHIWRALQWYMIVQERIPGLTTQYFIGKDPQILHLKTLDKIESEKQNLQAQFNRLNDQFLWQKRLLYFLMFFSTLLAGLLVLSFMK